MQTKCIAAPQRRQVLSLELDVLLHTGIEVEIDFVSPATFCRSTGDKKSTATLSISRRYAIETDKMLPQQRGDATGVTSFRSAAELEIELRNICFAMLYSLLMDQYLANT